MKQDKMKKNSQQQILFSEIEVNSTLETVQDGESQIIFDNQQWLPVEQALKELSKEPMNDVIFEEKPRWLWRILFSSISVIMLVELGTFFIEGFASSPITTSIYALIFACLGIMSGGALLRELSGLRQFKHQQKMKLQVSEVLEEKGSLNARQFCDQISEHLPSDLLSEQEQKWAKVLEQEYSDVELLQLYSKLVLSKVDQKAMEEVSRFSTEAVVLVALSPVAVIDMLIILWRNLRMINKVAGLYGLKLGYWSRIKLIKQVFINMAYAGASQLVADYGSQIIGADLLGKLSARLAQGLGAGMLTARLGLKTMQLCRPIPFDENPPKLTDIRKEILEQIKLLTKKSNP